MKKKVQIIGRVSGLPRVAVELKFAESKSILEGLGYEAINPVELVPENASWEEAMRICLRSLLDVDSIAIQRDWVKSPGALVEYIVASALRLEIIRI